MPMAASTSGGRRHLREAEPEYELAHGQQARGLQLQPDHEQEQHHPQLREAEHRVDVLDDGKAPRPQQHAAREVGEHGAQPETLEQRHGDDGGAEEYGDGGQQAHGS